MSLTLDLSVIGVGAALALRFGVIMATLPMLDMRTVPPLWRVVMAICLAAAVTPFVAAAIPPPPVDLSWPLAVAEALRSLVIGAMLGFTVNLVFTAVRVAGSIAGMQVGFSIVNSLDPLTQSQISVLSQLYYLLAVLLFFVTNGHHVLVGAMVQSCQVIPPFGGLDPAGGAWYLLKEFSKVFSIGLRIAAPVALVLLMVSGAMGVIVKTVPQLNILVVGFPVKIGVGLFVFGVSMVFFKELTLGMLGGLDGMFDDLLLALK